MAIDRVGAMSQVSRDSQSAGLELRERREAQADGPAQSPRNEKVDEVAKMYEKQFLREMVKAMRSTVSFGAMKPSMAEGIYRGQLDEQYVDAWGDKGGIGLSDLIYEQVMDRYFNTESGRRLKGQGSGAIELTDRDIAKVYRVKSADAPGQQVPLRIEIKSSDTGVPAKLQAPWDSEVVGRARLEGGKTALTLQHGPSLRSTLIFQGVPTADAQPGAILEKGKTVGILSPEIQSFFWNLNKTGQAPDSGPGPAASTSKE